MRTNHLVAVTLTSLALVGGLAACSSTSGSTTGSSGSDSSNSTSSSSAAAVGSSAKLTGTFMGENGKKVAGSVTIAGQTVKLTGFSSDEGPDLHLYLTNGTSESETTSGTEFAAVSFDTASQTFTLPSGVDASKFTDLVVHCDKAKAVFGAAALSK